MFLVFFSFMAALHLHHTMSPMDIMTSSNRNILALLAICVGNSLVTGEFPSQRPVTRSFNVFFHLRLNKPLSKQSWCWWFGTPSRSLWCHCNEWGWHMQHCTPHGNSGCRALISIIKTYSLQFCTSHDRCAVMACAKIYCDLMVRKWITTRQSFHRTWITSKSQ